MYRTFTLCGMALAGFVGLAPIARADVDVRAPFVRVQVNGGGVFVRAPFVRIFVPRTAPVYVVPPPAEMVLPPPQVVPGQVPQKLPPANPQPQVRFPSMDEFVRTFQPREGQYEVTIVNPLNGQPTLVRFTLPAGSPRVLINQQDIEFDYGVGKSVRIAFTPQGVAVTP